MEGKALREKLRARRRAMEVTMQSEPSADTLGAQSDVTGSESLPPEHIDEESEETLRSALESRREKSKRKLELEERDQTRSPEMMVETLNQTEEDLASPRTSSLAQLQDSGSVRTDPGSRSSTPFGRSQHTSLRSRLQAKLQQSRMSTAGQDAFRQERRRLKDRIDRTTRFSVSVKQRDLEEEEDLIKKIESKLKWKHAAVQAKEKYGEPTDEECYDFFTKQYPDVAEVEPSTSVVQEEIPPTERASSRGEEGQEGDIEAATSSQAQPSQQIEEERVHEVDETDETKRLISDVIFKDLDWRLFSVTAAEYPGYHRQVEIENLTYFVPSKLPPNFRDKVREDANPRYLEDEGFYVGERPVILQTNVNILEHRMLRQPDRGGDWFGLDGRVDSLPNPVKTIPTKPWVEADTDIDVSLETTYAKAYIPVEDDKYLQGSDENELQLDIGTVVFLYHPLMSREHVLASNISQMYDEYLDMRRKNYVNFFIDKLAALRNAVNNLKDKSASFSLSTDVSAQEARIHDFMSEIRRTTRQLNNAESTERELMRRIIEEWKEIKSLREFQGCTNTSVKLTVKREGVNQVEDRKVWEEEVRREVQERREEYETTILKKYQEEMRKYQNQLQEWKKHRQRIKQQRKKSKEKENLLDEQPETEEEDITIAGNIDKPHKLEKPQDFDEEVVKVEVMNSLYANRRNPGEDKISLLLTNTVNITPINAVPGGEAARRKAMQKSSILLKVRINGKEVFTTEAKSLTTDFKLHFGSIFRVRIAQWPESLKVQFLDAGLIMNSVFSEVFLRVPDTNVHSGNVQLSVTLFTSEQVVSYDHEGVGSNTPFTLRKNDAVPTSINMKGQLISSVSWGLNEEGRVLAPKGVVSNDPFSVVDPVSAIGAEGIQDPASLSKWIQDTRLDPNDPNNAPLIPFMYSEQDGHGFLYAPDYFRLEQLQEEFNFLTDEEFTRMNRFRLLQLRDEEVNEFRNLTMVPCQEHEVMDSTFTTYERRIRERDTIMAARDTSLEGRAMSVHRLEVMRYREKVKEAVLHRFYTARHHRTFEDIVHEEQVPDIGTLAVRVTKVFEPRRPLKPIRRERKKAAAQSLSEGSVNILISVVRGFNVPIRQASHTAGGGLNTTQNIAARLGAGTQSYRAAQGPVSHDFVPKSYSVAPFVAVSFQDNVVTSSVAQGPMPSWNEELQVPFSAPNSDYSATSLQTVDDVIYIHLFDRVIEETPQPYGQEDASLVTHKITNHWLGTFKLPFSTLYHRGKIDGTFKLKVPPFLLGYDLEKPVTDEFEEQAGAQFTRLSSGTYLTLFMTLEPTLKPMEPVRERFESQEDEHVLMVCAKYMAECQKKFPKRNAKATVIDLKGQAVLVTRYVKPLQPPAELIEGSEHSSFIAAERVARFVSLLPFASDHVTYAGICDLWSTCDQFIHMLRGDEEEHAVLLLNYFLYLGKKAYLLLGHAVPEGETAYVLTMEDLTGEIYIWNASTGEHFRHNDKLCPFKSVATLVNSENVWFNIQPHDTPSKVRYELTRTSDWKSLFTGSFPNPGNLHSIQPESLFYVNTDAAFVAKITQSLKDKLKEKMMAWRPRHVTRWNRACEAVLLDILKGLELRRLKKLPEDTNHAAELLQRIGDVRLTGFPMDMPFTDIDSVISAVRSTEVHKIHDPNVEFSVAVYIYPYPASVLAVWVYVAALVNRRRNDL